MKTLSSAYCRHDCFKHVHPATSANGPGIVSVVHPVTPVQHPWNCQYGCQQEIRLARRRHSIILSDPHPRVSMPTNNLLVRARCARLEPFASTMFLLGTSSTLVFSLSIASVGDAGSGCEAGQAQRHQD